MITKGIVKKGEYYDSVTLMLAAKRLGGLPGVIDSAVVMGTAENRAILAASGLLLAGFEHSIDSDLLVAVRAEDEQAADAAIAGAGDALTSLRPRPGNAAGALPRGWDQALAMLPGANLAMVSVAGRYAGGLAMDALRRGLHVMLFSDNVPLEQEIDLKRYAAERGLLVMGPDCGTAIINGAPLAFANAVNRGNIGVVAAAGTGMQEVTCLIANAGAGVSQAIGTGGRDVKREVGGLMFLQGLRMLDADPATAVVLLVSKPPHPEVLAKIGAQTASMEKPVVAVFLGADAKSIAGYGMRPAATLAEAARLATSLSLGKELPSVDDTDLAGIARAEQQRLAKGQEYIRGLFSGGTFCYEAQLILQDLVKGEIRSNAPTGQATQLADALHCVGHTVVDLGGDEFTVGRPHPMIDFSLRNKRIVQEAADPGTAVILLDLVLGYGSHPDPLAEIVPAIREGRRIANEGRRTLSVVASVTGTDKDPQNRPTVVAGLRDAGVLVMGSNAAAAALAGRIVKGTGR